MTRIRVVSDQDVVTAPRISVRMVELGQWIDITPVVRAAEMDVTIGKLATVKLVIPRAEVMFESRLEQQYIDALAQVLRHEGYTVLPPTGEAAGIEAFDPTYETPNT